ncbi:hypothetical protein LINPERHAP1_LOCUS17623, partial [Linum perenne]
MNLVAVVFHDLYRNSRPCTYESKGNDKLLTIKAKLSLLLLFIHLKQHFLMFPKEQNMSIE